MLRKYLPSILFLALCVPPLTAVEDSLVGTWEASGEDPYGASFTRSLTFREDGTFELSSNSRMEDGFLLPAPQFEHDEDLTSADADSMNQMFRAAWPEVTVETTSSLGTGTYVTSGDSLGMELLAIEITCNDRDFTDFFVSLYTEFGLNLEALERAADGRDFPEEDRLELEQELTALYQEHLSTEAVRLSMNEYSPTSYEILDGGQGLILQGRPSSEEGWFQEAEPQVEPLVYRRIDVPSAVTPATWGGVKSTLAP